MKNDSDNVKIVQTIVGGVTFSIIAIAFSATLYYTVTEKTAMEEGYEQSTIPGEFGIYWVKSKTQPPQPEKQP